MMLVGSVFVSQLFVSELFISERPLSQIYVSAFFLSDSLFRNHLFQNLSSHPPPFAYTYKSGLQPLHQGGMKRYALWQSVSGTWGEGRGGAAIRFLVRCVSKCVGRVTAKPILRECCAIIKHNIQKHCTKLTDLGDQCAQHMGLLS